MMKIERISNKNIILIVTGWKLNDKKPPKSAKRVERDREEGWYFFLIASSKLFDI